MIQVIQIVTGGWAIFIGLVLLICSLIIEKRPKADPNPNMFKAVPGSKADPNTFMFRAVLGTIILYQLADMLAWQFGGKAALINTIMVRVSNLICYLSVPILLMILCNYTYTQIKDAGQKRRFAFLVMRNIGGGVMLAIAVLNLFTGWIYSFDEQNRFVFKEGFAVFLYYACGGFLLLRCHVIAWRYRKSRNASMLLRIRIACLLNELAFFFQLLIYGYVPYSMTLTAGAIMLFTGLLRERAEQQSQKQLQLEANRKDLARTRQQMLQLQIQPHFMYNTMAAIQAQVLENKDQAYESIGIFSSFLRDTIRFSAMDQRIPVEEELSFAEKYLDLAELRFGDKLNIDFDIQDTDFSVPAFTIQPLIENALNHGLKPFDHEGTITLRTYRKTEGNREVAVLEVEDNGVGMNPTILNHLRMSGSWENEFRGNEQPASGQQVSSQPNIRLQENSRPGMGLLASVQPNIRPQESSRSGMGIQASSRPNNRPQEGTHIGLHNVQQRIEMSCGGRLEVESPVQHRKAEEILPEEVLPLTIQTMIDQTMPDQTLTNQALLDQTLNPQDLLKQDQINQKSPAQTQSEQKPQKPALQRVGTKVRLILPNEETTL